MIPSKFIESRHPFKLFHSPLPIFKCMHFNNILHGNIYPISHKQPYSIFTIVWLGSLVLPQIPIKNYCVKFGNPVGCLFLWFSVPDHFFPLGFSILTLKNSWNISSNCIHCILYKIWEKEKGDHEWLYQLTFFSETLLHWQTLGRKSCLDSLFWEYKTSHIL